MSDRSFQTERPPKGIFRPWDDGNDAKTPQTTPKTPPPHVRQHANPLELLLTPPQGVLHPIFGQLSPFEAHQLRKSSFFLPRPAMPSPSSPPGKPTSPFAANTPWWSVHTPAVHAQPCYRLPPPCFHGGHPVLALPCPLPTMQTRKCRRCQCPNCVNPTPPGETRKKLHVCHIPECGKSYGKTSHLKAHLRWHAGQYSAFPFSKCASADERFPCCFCFLSVCWSYLYATSLCKIGHH